MNIIIKRNPYFIEEKSLKWYGHVTRACDHGWITRTTEWSSIARRKPQRIWRNEIDNAIRERGTRNGE